MFIANANGISNPNLIIDGTKLTIPQYTGYVAPTLNVGDTVKIIGKGNARADGTGGVAGGTGWTRTIQKIYSGKPYPYQVGNSTGTTGFYPASSLQKL